MPEAPKPWDDLFRWPQRLLDTIYGVPMMWGRLVQHWAAGVHSMCYYAGMLTETNGLHYIDKEMLQRGHRLPGSKCLFSVDLGTGPQKVFHAMPSEVKPLHGFLDINDLLPDSVRAKLDEMQPDYAELAQATGQDRVSLLAKHASRYMAMADYLLECVAEGQLKRTTARCIRHDRDCDFCPKIPALRGPQLEKRVSPQSLFYVYLLAGWWLPAAASFPIDVHLASSVDCHACL